MSSAIQTLLDWEDLDVQITKRPAKSTPASFTIHSGCLERQSFKSSTDHALVYYVFSEASSISVFSTRLTLWLLPSICPVGYPIRTIGHEKILIMLLAKIFSLSLSLYIKRERETIFPLSPQVWGLLHSPQLLWELLVLGTLLPRQHPCRREILGILWVALVSIVFTSRL